MKILRFSNKYHTFLTIWYMESSNIWIMISTLIASNVSNIISKSRSILTHSWCEIANVALSWTDCMIMTHRFLMQTFVWIKEEVWCNTLISSQIKNIIVLSRIKYDHCTYSKYFALTIRDANILEMFTMNIGNKIS